MKHPFKILLLSLALLPALVAGQTPRADEKFSGYAIRFHLRGDLNSFYPIPASGISVGITASGVQSPDPSAHTEVSMLYFSAERRDDQWDVSVSVTLSKGERQILAGKRVKPGERIRLEKFKEYHLLPGDVSIVKIDPVMPIEPEIINLTSAIEVAAVKATVIPMSFHLVLKNNSGQPVQALEVNSYKGENWGSLIWPEGSFDRFLIPPGETHAFDVKSDAGYRLVAPDEYEPVQTDKIEIATVVFLDGSYEGKPHLAGLMAANSIGAAAQLDRVLPLIAAALDSHDTRKAELLANLKAAVQALSLTIEPAFTEKLRVQFPMMNQNELKGVNESIGRGLAKVKNWILSDINKFINESKDPSDSVQAWLTEEQQKFARWRSQLP